MKLTTENIKRKNPINRNNFFTSQDQVNFQIGIGMEYVNKILNQTIVLYEVDREKTKVNDIYNEAKFSDLVFKTPIELNVIYKLDKGELKTYKYDKGILRKGWKTYVYHFFKGIGGKRVRYSKR